jgi:hypothetical protein
MSKYYRKITEDMMDREPEVVVHAPATTYANRYFILPLLFCDMV